MYFYFIMVTSIYIMYLFILLCTFLFYYVPTYICRIKKDNPIWKKTAKLINWVELVSFRECIKSLMNFISFWSAEGCDYLGEVQYKRL